MASMVQAIRLALHVAEERFGVTDVFGQDVGPPLGGIFTQTQGLKTAWNTPLDERGIVGMAIGLAMAGQRPVAEIQFCDYAFNMIDLLKLAGGMTWSSAGDWNCPLVLMMPVGSGVRGSIYHSHSFDAQATRVPGWKIVMPSNPLDAYGLMLSAIVDPNPVMYLAPKALLRVKGTPAQRIPGEPDNAQALSKMIDAPLGDRSAWVPRWPDTPDLLIPIGQASIAHPGRHVTLVSYGRMMHVALQAAEELLEEGIEVEVIDLRTLAPYDWQAIKDSVHKTRRVLFLNEDTEITNFGEHLMRRTVDELFYELEAPPKLLAGAHVPGIGLADALERASVPQLEEVVATLRALARHVP
ncbi:MAG TPA: transketolase C-terminal domain-containing protein [Polyangiales bacterium]|nr:transketolase C-terminal domain-containing protein [Polyangiales bacterium]